MFIRTQSLFYCVFILFMISCADDPKSRFKDTSDAGLRELPSNVDVSTEVSVNNDNNNNGSNNYNDINGADWNPDDVFDAEWDNTDDNPTQPEVDQCDPNALEECDHIDNNCNGMVDEGCSCGGIAQQDCFPGILSNAGVGICTMGVQYCEQEFFGACEGFILPELEKCDSLDNDCDGLIDEDFPAVGQPCDTGVGSCASQGILVCNSDGSDIFCNAVEIEQQSEICDGLDNDCNGEIDDTFPDLHQPCTAGIGVCQVEGIFECSDSGTATVCNAQAIPPTPEVCDGIDNNCDGEIDNGLGIGESCEVGLGLCARAGIMVCNSDGSVGCDAIPGQPQQEVCDELDNDCNGSVDELPECSNHAPSLICPGIINSAPLQSVNLSVSASDPDGDPLTYHWEVTSRPLGSMENPSPNNQANASLFLDMAGEYILTVTVTDPHGLSERCTVTIIAIPTEALRVELAWNIGIPDEVSDVDLHLSSTGNDWFNSLDCYYGNCRGNGLAWGNPGSGDDPRLDIDDVTGHGPENINMDTPNNQTYTVGVHYYSDHSFGPSSVLIKIYCNMQMVREFELVTLQASGSSGNNDFWKVAEVVWNGSTCTIHEFGSPGNRVIVPTSSVR